MSRFFDGCRKKYIFQESEDQYQMKYSANICFYLFLIFNVYMFFFFWFIDRTMIILNVGRQLSQKISVPYNLQIKKMRL
jgi:hypothetical protein